MDPFVTTQAVQKKLGELLPDAEITVIINGPAKGPLFLELELVLPDKPILRVTHDEPGTIMTPISLDYGYTPQVEVALEVLVAFLKS